MLIKLNKLIAPDKENIFKNTVSFGIIMEYGDSKDLRTALEDEEFPVSKNRL